MRRLVNSILILINLALAALLIASFLCRFIEPETYLPFSFLGLIFPVLALANVIFLIYWIIIFKKPAWISLITLLIVTPAINSSLRIFKTDSKEADKQKVSVMSYNVRLFDVFNWSGKDNVGVELLDFAGKSKTDIICFQEFMVNNSNALNLSQIKSLLPDNQYSYIDYNYQAFQRKHGLAIFSSYPVISGKKGIFPGTRNMYIYADIKLPADTVRVFNAHLESIHLNYQQYNLIDSLNVNQNNRQEIRRILANIKEAFLKRTEQVEILQKEIDASPYPVIVCGDFNDTPASYTYSQLKRKLKDTFMESGSGLGTTYKEFVFPLRIDYILHSKEITGTGHRVLNQNFSDHKPIKANLSIRP